MSIFWIFNMTEDLLELQAKYQEDFEYIANYKHLGI